MMATAWTHFEVALPILPEQQFATFRTFNGQIVRKGAHRDVRVRAIEAHRYFRLLTILTHALPPNPLAHEPRHEGWMPSASCSRLRCSERKNLSFYLPLFSDTRQS